MSESGVFCSVTMSFCFALLYLCYWTNKTMTSAGIKYSKNKRYDIQSASRVSACECCVSVETRVH